MAVRVVLIGCGGRGTSAHGAWAVKSERLDLVAVCDVDAGRLQAASARLGVPGEADYRRLLARADVQGVLIATGARWHAPIALEAIAAGKHVFVEKPLADSPESADAMACAVRAAGLVGVVGYQFRMSPFAAALAAELPAIEPVQALLTVQRGPMAPQYFFPDHYGGVLDTATHTIHLALWAMGGQAEGVMAHVRRGTIAGDQTIEYASLLIDFDGGTRSAALVTSMFGVRAPNLVEFVGSHGVVSSTGRLTAGVLQVVRHAGVGKPGAGLPEGLEVRTVETAAGRPDTEALLDHFADLIEGKADAARPTACTFEQGAEAVAVTAAMARSAQEGRRVTLAEVARTA